MENFSFSVVIATYNRFDLLKRAVESVKNAALSSGCLKEIIVIDDFSDQDISKITDLYPDVKYMRQPKNMGPGSARDRGILEAKSDYVIILDDDDELLGDCIKTIEPYVNMFPNFPVIQFARSNGLLKSSGVKSLEDYILGDIQGDFAPVINRKVYLDNNLCYPDNRIGGEHLLWWRIAQQWGIPTFQHTVMKLNDDAQERLTSVDTQIRKAAEHSRLAEDTIQQFGSEILRISPSFYGDKVLGAITYSVLSKNRGNLLLYLRLLLEARDYNKLIKGVIISLLPHSALIGLFKRYRS